MFKKLIFPSLIAFSCLTATAQSADSIYDKYLDFNKARFEGQQDKLMGLGEQLLPVAGKLPEKARFNFYFSMGKLYEDNNQSEKAVYYFEKVAAAVPDYYVVHRALGYQYLEEVKAIEIKLNASINNIAENKRLTDVYIKAVKEALPHLEKAQACDPSDETLVIIKVLYKNIKDTAGLNSLNNRLKELSVHCIDILSDQ